MEIGLVSLYLLIFLTYLINWSRRSASLVLISKRGYQFLFWLRLINLQWSLINRSMFRLTKISRLAYFTVWYPRAFKSIQKWDYLVSGVYNFFYKVSPQFDKWKCDDLITLSILIPSTLFFANIHFLNVNTGFMILLWTTLDYAGFILPILPSISVKKC